MTLLYWAASTVTRPTRPRKWPGPFPPFGPQAEAGEFLPPSLTLLRRSILTSRRRVGGEGAAGEVAQHLGFHWVLD
jgi:hypothetical protein